MGGICFREKVEETDDGEIDYGMTPEEYEDFKKDLKTVDPKPMFKTK